MKKIFGLVSLLIVAAACATGPTGNNNVTSNANMPPETKTSNAGAVSESDIIAKEKASWDAIKKKDWDAFGKTLSSDYLEVMDDGAHDKAATLQSIKDFD